MWLWFLINCSYRILDFDGVDEGEPSDVETTESNVRKDLSEWQERHATLVLTTVKVFSILFLDILLSVYETWKDRDYNCVCVFSF